MPSPGYPVSGKEVEVHDSGSRHHQLCGCCNLQLIQSHVAPSHGPPARVLPLLFFPAKSLLLPKPRGKKKHSKPSWSSLLPFRTVWPSPFPPRIAWSSLSFYFRTVWPPIYFRTAWSSTYLLWSRVVYSPQNLLVLPFTSELRGLLLSMAARPRFKSQHPSSFAAPFLTPPTVSYTCQHHRILPAVLGCHSKSGQVWPHGMEPILSKLSRRPCNQGELLPRPTLGGSHSHLPGSKQGHSYLTYP